MLKSRSFFSGLLVSALTLALSFAGAVFSTSPASAVGNPTFSIGALAAPEAGPTALFPNFSLSLNGATITGFRVTNLTYASSGSQKDRFSISLNSGNMGNSVSTSSGNDYLQVTAPNASEAQWQVAIRQLMFDAGSADVLREFEFMLLASPNIVATTSLNFDLVAPSVSSISAINANGTFVAGNQVQYRVRFSEALAVTGTPTLSLAMSAGPRLADCALSTTTNTDLICTYTVQQGDTAADLEHSSTSALSLSAATIKDLGGNNALVTLPEALSQNSSLVIEGNLNVVTLSANPSTSTDGNLVFALTSSLPVDCSTISTVNGVDFNFTKITAINSITAAGDNLTCTITATSSVQAGQFGQSGVAKALTFSINDLQATPIATTALTVSGANVSVNIAAASGQGVVSRVAVNGTAQSSFIKTPPAAVFGTLSEAAKAALKTHNVLAVVDNLPGAEIQGDFSLASGRVDAMKVEQVVAGDRVSLGVKVDTGIVATHQVAAFFKATADATWTFLGRRDFDSTGVAASDSMVFAKRGTYVVRLIVVAKNATFLEASTGSISFRRAALSDSSLPAGVQSLEVTIEVTGIEPAVVEAALPPVEQVIPPVEPVPPVTPPVDPVVPPTTPVEPVAPVVPPVVPPVEPVAPPVEPVAPVNPVVPPAEPAAPEVAPPAAAPAPVEPAPEAAPAPAEPVAIPDDSAAPVPFDPLGSPEAIAAVTKTTATALVIVAAAAAAAAAAAGAAGGSSSSSSSNSETSAEGATESEGDIAELEIAQDNFTIETTKWGDGLAWFAIPGITLLDRLSHNLSLKFARFSPLAAKLVNDGAYLRAIVGSPVVLASIAAAVLGAISALGNNGQMLTPAWQALLVIAVLGIFDAAAGFTGASVFIAVSVISALVQGTAIGIGDVRLMFGIMVLAIGPAMLITAFRTLRKHPANDFKSWWERLTDLAVSPFMAGWSTFAMVSVMPALAGLTLNVANHVNEFALAVAAAALIRVGIEEVAARYYPARLNRINPDFLPEPSVLQRSISLALKFAIWIILGGALIGETWQLWVGAALFLLPTIIGWFQERFPNSPVLWRILPSGVPGLALTLIVATITSGLVNAAVGTVPALASWSFVFLPLPLLVLSLLGMVGRHGSTDEELKPAQRNVWIYRIGGVLMLLGTLRLAGIV